MPNASAVQHAYEFLNQRLFPPLIFSMVTPNVILGVIIGKVKRKSRW